MDNATLQTIRTDDISAPALARRRGFAWWQIVFALTVMLVGSGVLDVTRYRATSALAGIAAPDRYAEALLLISNVVEGAVVFCLLGLVLTYVLKAFGSGACAREAYSGFLVAPAITLVAEALALAFLLAAPYLESWSWSVGPASTVVLAIFAFAVLYLHPVTITLVVVVILVARKVGRLSWGRAGMVTALLAGCSFVMKYALFLLVYPENAAWLALTNVMRIG